jgi:hypothetical protein
MKVGQSYRDRGYIYTPPRPVPQDKVSRDSRTKCPALCGYFLKNNADSNASLASGNGGITSESGSLIDSR